MRQAGFTGCFHEAEKFSMWGSRYVTPENQLRELTLV